MPTSIEKRISRRRNDLKPIRIYLKQRWLRLHDVSNEGIGIVLENDGPGFFIGERIDAIPIPLEEGTAYLNGVVSHVSETDTERICGIRFLFSGEDFDIAIRFRRQCLLKPGEPSGKPDPPP